jgi:vitamin B12 transporter
VRVYLLGFQMFSSLKSRTSCAGACALIVAIAAPFSIQVHATELLPEMVVTATKVPQRASDVFADISVWTREDIDRSQAETVADLLAGESGFEFGRNGGPGSTASIFLRGAPSTNVVILVDGVRAPIDGIGSVIGLDIPIALIQRVELVRGDQSALYGDAANGGVLQIFTRDSNQQRNDAAVGFGSRGAHKAIASLSGGETFARYALILGKDREAALSAIKSASKPQANPDIDISMSNFVSLSFDLDKGSLGQFGIGLRAVNASLDYDSGNSWDSPSDTHSVDSATQRFDLSWKKRVTSAWTTELVLASDQQEFKDFKNGSRALGAYSNGLRDVSHNQVRWSNTWARDADTTVLSGVEYERANYLADATSSGYDARRITAAGFLGLYQRFGDYQLQLNTRFDDTAIRDKERNIAEKWSTFSNLAGLSRKLKDGVVVSVRIAKGFRLPTVYDVNDSFNNGNPRFTPEKQTSGELSVEKDFEAMSGRLTYFSYKSPNAIVTNLSSYQQVTQRIENTGYEARLSGQIGEADWQLAYTIQDPKNLDSGKQAARRAKQFGSFRLTAPLGTAKIGGVLRFSEGRKDSDFSDDRMHGYSVLDLTYSNQLSKKLKISVKFENVFNREYELAKGYQTPRRGVMAYATHSFD